MIEPFQLAVERHAGKTPVASALRTDEWDRVALGLREAAQFSAGVTEIKTVAAIQEKVGKALQGQMDRSQFVSEMRGLLGATTDSKKLTDIASRKRQSLIYDFQVEDAYEYGRWKASQDADLLQAFPAQELIRHRMSRVPRDWQARWQSAGGQLYEGRMIALKNSGVWTAISRFGRPFPPFDFGSGMGVRDISRREAIRLGVITPEAPPPAPQDKPFTEALEASVADLDANLQGQLKARFGDQVVIEQGKAKWQGQAIRDLVAKAENPQIKQALNLGKATQDAVAKAKAAGEALDDYQLFLTTDHIRHIKAGHPDLTVLDLELIPHVWRNPDSIKVSTKRKNHLEFEKDILGKHILIEWQRQPNTKRAEVRTYYTTPKGQGPDGSEGTP